MREMGVGGLATRHEGTRDEELSLASRFVEFALASGRPPARLHDLQGFLVIVLSRHPSRPLAFRCPSSQCFEGRLYHSNAFMARAEIGRKRS